MSNTYREFLEYLELSEEEIAADLEDFIYACNKTGLSEEDVAYAQKEWIPANWCAQYKGTRMALGAWVREFIDVCRTHKYKAEGKKLVYGILPAYSNLYYALQYADPSVYIAFPDILLTCVLNGVFHKAGPMIAKAEDQITPGCRHCPLNKMRLSAYTTGTIAAPNVIWSWGFNCDEGPKTDELIQNLCGDEWHYVISRAPHDSPFGVPDDEIRSRLDHVAQEYRTGFNTICNIIDVKVDPEHFAAANNDIARLSFKCSQLIQMMCKADPPVLTGNIMTVISSFQLFPLSRGLKHMEAAADVLIGEIKQAMKDGVGILPKGSPKVATYFASPAVPWFDKLFRDNGVCTTYSLITTPVKKQMSREYVSDDPFMIMAEMWLRRGSIQNMGADIDGMVERCETHKPDGVVMGFFDFDRWLGAHQKTAAKRVEERTGVPHFYMECDFYDDRDYTEDSMSTRVESICQVLKMRKEIEE